MGMQGGEGSQSRGCALEDAAGLGGGPYLLMFGCHNTTVLPTSDSSAWPVSTASTSQPLPLQQGCHPVLPYAVITTVCLGFRKQVACPMPAHRCPISAQ